MSAYEFADLITPLVEAVMFFMLFEAFLSRREKLKTWHYIVGMIALAGMISICNRVFSYTFLNILGLVLSAFLLSFLYRGEFGFRLIASVSGILISGVLEILVMYLITVIFDISVSEAIYDQEYRLLGIIASKISGLACCNAIRIQSSVKKLSQSNTYWLLFFLLFLSSLLTISLLFIMSYEINDERYNSIAVLCAMGLLFSTFFALYIYERIVKQSEAIRSQEQYEQHLRSQLKHLDDIIAGQNELRRFKHDLSNQLAVVRGYFERQDNEAGERYLDELDQRFLKGHAVVDTGNTALDAIISTKQALAESKGIVFQMTIQIAEHFPIEPVDACMIFGNALDNAIEACERLDSGEKHITLTLIQQDETLFCKIVNSAPPGQHHDLQTSKRDKDAHGLGLLNIKDALARYDSGAVIEWENGIFSLSFLIDL